MKHHQLLYTFSILLCIGIQGCSAPHHRTIPSQRQPIPQTSPHPVQVLPPRPAPARLQPVPPPANPVVANIRQKAERLMNHGKLQAAAQTLERGLRIAPKNAALWTQLALVRLRQGRFSQALSLAAKSNSLAGGNSALLARNQQITNQARRKKR